MTRLLGSLLMTALSAGGFLAQAAGDTRAADLLKEARAALGGDAAVNRVQALLATGHIARAAGATRLEGDLTLQFALPDRLLRTEALSPDGGLTLITEQGVRGNVLLRGARTFNAPPGAVIRTPPPPARGSEAEAEALRAARADLARLSLGLLLKAPGTQPLDFAYGGTAESPDGTADVLDVKGRDGSTFAAKLLLDRATHRPLMLTYRGVAPRMVVQTRRVERGTPPPDASQVPSAPPSEAVDIEVFYDDYRTVGGLMLPHHITRSVGGDVQEEWTFSSWQVNPTFKPDAFDVKP